MLNNLLNFIFSIFRYLFNHLNWIKNQLLHVKAGSAHTISFPFRIEGSGSYKTGNHSSIGNSVRLALANNSIFETGDQFAIGNNAEIILATGTLLVFGNDCSIGAGSLVQVHANWMIGNKSGFSRQCQIFAREKGCNGSLLIGEGTNVGDFCIIDVSGTVNIGSQVAIGPGSIIYTHDHAYQENRIIPWHGTAKVQAVEISNGAWIGSRVTILPGVHIGEGAIVAAGSVVVTNVPAFTLYGGIPAKKIKDL